MDIYYRRRCVIKVTEGNDDTAKYLVLVNTYNILKPKENTWSPMMSASRKDSFAEYPATFLFTKNEMERTLDSPFFDHRNRHGRSRVMTEFLNDDGFEEWIMDGFKTSMTVEEHLKAGNEIKVVWHHSSSKSSSLSLSSSNDLLVVENELVYSSEMQLGITFIGENLKIKLKETTDPDSYVVKLSSYSDRAFLLRGATKDKIYRARAKLDIKRFPTEIEALEYCEEFSKRIGRHGYEIVCVGEGNHLDHIIDNYGNTLI